MKIKEFESIGKCLDLARNLRKLLNIKVTVLPVVVGTLGVDPQRPGKEIRGR